MVRRVLSHCLDCFECLCGFSHHAVDSLPLLPHILGMRGSSSLRTEFLAPFQASSLFKSARKDWIEYDANNPYCMC